MSQRFARHELITDWRQERLTSAVVVIAGVGALGNWTAQALALAGVGRLILCDADVVSLSNLSRTPLFVPADVGRSKVEAAAARLRELAPDTTVEARSFRFEAAMGLAELRDDVTLVVSCLDSRAARLELAGRCALVRKPYIDGATHPWGGEVRPFLHADDACYSCGLSSQQRGVGDVPWTCLDVPENAPQGASAPSSGLIGSWMSLLAVRALSGAFVSPNAIAVDAAYGQASQVAIVRDPACPLHRSVADTVRIRMSASETVTELYRHVPTGAGLILWHAVERGANCPRCHWSVTGWREANPRACPTCGTALLLDTTLEITRDAGDISLRNLGVPDREILAVRSTSGMIFLEMIGP